MLIKTIKRIKPRMMRTEAVTPTRTSLENPLYSNISLHLSPRNNTPRTTPQLYVLHKWSASRGSTIITDASVTVGAGQRFDHQREVLQVCKDHHFSHDLLTEQATPILQQRFVVLCLKNGLVTGGTSFEYDHTQTDIDIAGRENW